jgi:hypothetical protein
LMMVEIVALRLVMVPDVDHTNPDIGNVLCRRLTPYDRNWLKSQEHAAREKFVFVRAARVSENRVKWRHRAPNTTDGSVTGNPHDVNTSKSF